uniref:cell surface antigen I/II-like n=1 Tax=Erigeron canadensis TaxID=72917 RepID=UPI001CB9C14C|nr:cell surface antigen I/II-like [Erigeron canadensis]
MGFSSVYRVLQEVFPQVDSRILRAVAIEHSKDADTAVEVVLVEIIPSLSEQSFAVRSSNTSTSSLSLTEDGGKTGQVESSMNHVVIKPSPTEQLTEVRLSSVYGSLSGAMEVNEGSSGQQNSPTALEPETWGHLEKSSYHDASDTEVDSVNSGGLSVYKRRSCDNLDQGSVKYDGDNVALFGESSGDKAGVSGSVQEEESLHLGTTAPSAKFDKHINLDVGTLTLVTPGSNCEMNVAVPKESDPSCSSGTASEKDAFGIHNVNSEDESAMSSMLAGSEEECNSEFLEEIVEDAKNNKKTLNMAMNSFVDLIKEVESKENAVEQAKEEANRGCSDIIAKADEVKQALLRAKEANDMHAGEVHAEKAILATELKELQLRLLTLSDDRNKYLGILDEMRRAYEIRLAKALEELAAAEEYKLEKEKSAREALAYQELQMEKVVEESIKLKREAEENSKLQEFLMDRGRTIDILQGEFSVKFQDILLLKEKFDQGIPLSRSLSSSQHSSILASSSSSLRSTVTPIETEPESETYKAPKRSAELGDSYEFFERSLNSEVAPPSPKSPIEKVDGFPFGEAKKIGKVPVDDGWELFESDDFLLR